MNLNVARRLEPLYSTLRRRMDAADHMSLQERSDLRHLRLAKVEKSAERVGLRPSDSTTKADLQSHPNLALGRHHQLPSISASTGGTSGIPLRLRRSLTSIIFEQATIDHCVNLAVPSLELASARVAVLRADSFKPPDDTSPPFWLDKGRIRKFSVNHLRAQSASAFSQALTEFTPDVLHCYPSALEMMLSFGVRPSTSPRLILTSSEVLDPSVRSAAAEFFDCEVLDVYGQAERVCLAYSLKPGEYWFRHDYGAVDLRPTAAGFAAVVGTNLHNSRMQFLNYEVGDEVAADFRSSSALEIAMGVAPFRSVVGRRNEGVLLPDGQRIIGLNHIPRLADGAACVQLVRTGEWSFDLRVVPGRTYSATTAAHLLHNIRQKFPSTASVEVVESSDPIRTSRGKVQQYVDAR